MPKTPPLLIREIDRIARDANWTTTTLAERIGCHPTMLMHLRAGRTQFSAELLSRIWVAFPLPQIDAAINHYVKIELPAILDAKREPQARATVLSTLDDRVQQALRAYVRFFARTSVESGHGLFLVGSDTKRLTLAAAFVAEAIAEQGISVMRMSANTKVTASEERNALGAALLIVERVDFISPTMRDLLLRRADVVKPIVVTSLADPGAATDAYLRRVFLSMTKTIRVSPSVAAAAPSAPIHAAR